MIDNWEWHAMAFDFVEDHTLEYIYQAFKERMRKELLQEATRTKVDKDIRNESHT